MTNLIDVTVGEYRVVHTSQGHTLVERWRAYTSVTERAKDPAVLVLAQELQRLKNEAAARPASAHSQSIVDVWTERQRQITAEGYTPAGDARYLFGELAEAGGCYALHAYDSNPSLPAHLRLSKPPAGWPWSRSVWKPRDPRRNLVRAAALIIAEIDAFDAKEAKK